MNAAPKKSRTQNASPYFAKVKDHSEQTEEDEGSPSEANEDASDFEESEPSEEEETSDSDAPASKSRGSSAKSTPKASEIWRPGVKTGKLLADTPRCAG